MIALLPWCRYWVTDVLKGELGFNGLVVSDWEAMFHLPGSLDDQVAAVVNSGIDMFMAAMRYREFHESLLRVVK